MQSIWQSHRAIGESVHFNQVEAIAVEFTQNRATAFCSKIYCHVIHWARHHSLLLFGLKVEWDS
jgi:hypothetical protein